MRADSLLNSEFWKDEARLPNVTTITSYMESLLYTVSRPHIAEILLQSVGVDRLKNVDANTKLISLGALLASGKLDECIQLSGQLNFDDISTADRPFLALYIFSIFHEHCLTNRHLANTLKHLLIAISPDSLLAHKKCKEPVVRSSMIKLNYAKNFSSSVKGAIFFREFLFDADSRKCEAGYRIQNALVSQGWEVPLFPMGHIKHYSSAIQSDFVIIDVCAFSAMGVDDVCAILSHLRRYFRKIIMVDVDVWSGTYDDMLRSLSGHIDYIWGFSADWCLSRETGFMGRSIQFPCLGGFDHLYNIIDTALDWNTCSFNFTGSVQGYSPNRIYWLLESMCLNLPIEINITNPAIDDGLDPLYSQHIYAQVLAATHTAINLTTRRDGSRPATGRAFEVISLNRLLVQENCPVFHNYFVKGEHFLEFSDIEELCTIIEFLRSHPKTAHKICSQGHQFYRERYSCRKLAEHIQTLL